MRRPASALWWSGIAAGISIGFSFLTEAALAAHLPVSEWSPIVAKLGYSVGFLIVILGHQQLFTENVLTAVLPLMARKQVAWLVKMLRLWGIVLAANMTGCLIFALAAAFLPIIPPDVGAALAIILTNVMSNTPWEMFAKGIGAGWLIAAVVWILASSEGVDFLVITLLTYLIALFGFTHIVAGSVEAIYGVVTGLIGADTALFRFFLPTLAGNVFGGTVSVLGPQLRAGPRRNLRGTLRRLTPKTFLRHPNHASLPSTSRAVKRGGHGRAGEVFDWRNGLRCAEPAGCARRKPRTRATCPIQVPRWQPAR